MKTNLFTRCVQVLIIVIIMIGCVNPKSDVSFKEAFKDKFYVGAALNKEQINGLDTNAMEIILQQFNSIVAENSMKSENIQPVEGRFYFDDADKFVDFGEKNNMKIIGHTLIWHSQTPPWFFIDENGDEVARDELIERMRNHITTVVGRYKGRVDGWDVVNEALEDNGSFRKSPFYRIIGEDYIRMAFQFAHDADPDAELYYNDYSMSIPAKRDAAVQLVKKMQDEGVRVDGIGMQGHLSMEFPSINQFEKSIEAFGKLGVKVMITELDLSALPSPWRNMGANISDTVSYQAKMNPYVDGLPADVEAAWEQRYVDFFKLFLKHEKTIDRVTLWGFSDKDSWKNDFPIYGRKDYALLYDRDYNPKPVLKKIIKEALAVDN